MKDIELGEAFMSSDPRMTELDSSACWRENAGIARALATGEMAKIRGLTAEFSEEAEAWETIQRRWTSYPEIPERLASLFARKVFLRRAVAEMTEDGVTNNYVEIPVRHVIDPEDLAA